MQWITKGGKHIPIFNKPIKLGRKEYGKVCHEINSNGSIEERKKDSMNIKNIGEYAYTYYYKDLDDIRFYGKVKIVGNERKIKLLREFLRSGTLYGFF